MINNVLIVTPGDYSHSQAFLDIAYSFSESLKAIGHPNQITTNPEHCDDGTTLVFGAHLISKLEGTIAGSKGEYIIYQTEQLTASNSLFVDDKYLDILRKFEVWDYSTNNINFLESKGIFAKYVPIGYSRELSNIKTGRSVSMSGGGRSGIQTVSIQPWSGSFPATDATGKFIQDIDVCFYGSTNERRTKIIDGLRQLTLKAPDGQGGIFDKPITVASFIGYSGFRDKTIARSKIVLNLHYYDSAIFEIFRCALPFANKKCVISETGADIKLESHYYETGTFVPYEKLVETCHKFLLDDTRRNEAALQQFDIFREAKQTDILKRIL